jgi:hypothetical protein
MEQVLRAHVTSVDFNVENSPVQPANDVPAPSVSAQVFVLYPSGSEKSIRIADGMVWGSDPGNFNKLDKLEIGQKASPPLLFKSIVKSKVDLSKTGNV